MVSNRDIALEQAEIEMLFNEVKSSDIMSNEEWLWCNGFSSEEEFEKWDNERVSEIIEGMGVL